MYQKKTETVWTKLNGLVDISDAGCLRLSYERDGKTSFAYIPNTDALKTILAHVNALKDTVSQIESQKEIMVLNKKAAQAFNRTFKAMFDLTQNESLAKQAGEAAKQAVLNAHYNAA